MKRILAFALLCLPITLFGQSDFYRDVLRRATFYAAVNGGNSVSDQDVFSVTTGPLTTEVVETPFDLSLIHI